MTNVQLAQTLQSAGVQYVFGHPGGEVVDVIDALETLGVQFILAGHESAAVFMAGTVGRLSGRPGVCLSTLGPGACNMVLGVGNALLDRDPLLALSARTNTSLSKRSNKQNLPLGELFSPISKWHLDLEGVDVAHAVSTALSVASTPPRGPVYMSIPGSSAGPSDERSESPFSVPARPAPDAGQFQQIVRAVTVARRPIAVVGLALDMKQDPEEVQRFLSRTEIPFVVLPRAKGCVDESADHFLGTVASAAGDAVLVDALRSSDCLLGIGFDPVESSQDWHYDRPFFSLASAPVGFNEFQPTAECTGEVSQLLARLREALAPASSAACEAKIGETSNGTEWTVAEVRDIHQQVFSSIEPSRESSPHGLSPFHVTRALREETPPATILASDVGAHKLIVSQAWQCDRPDTFLVSNGLSSMGYGVPAALAAALVSPDCPVVAIVGDGGFGMMVQELETARRMSVAPLIVVFCDRSLAIIKTAQTARGLPFRGVDFLPVNWARVADGFGVRGRAVQSLDALRSAVRTWLGDRQPTVLAVEIDENLYAGLTY